MNAFLQLLLFTNTVFSGTADTAYASYGDEINAWHAKRISNLKKDYGWLTLVALTWLNEGENRIANVGMISLAGEKVHFKPELPVAATVRGRTFSEGELKHGNTRDTVRMDSRAFIIIERDHRYAVRMWDTTSELRKQFTGIDRYPVSQKWRLEARWEPYNPPNTIKVPTVIEGYSEEYAVPGVAIFTVAGKEYRLEPVLEEPDGDYFFIFADKTNGKETYDAGRFLYAKSVRNGKVILDFNKAYNPPCAFTEYATCPLPPKGNKLVIAVDAGEKKYSGH